MESKELWLQGATPIIDLPLHYTVKQQLHTMNVYCLEDFSEVTEQEFRELPQVGSIAVEKIRFLLANLDMTFKTDTASLWRLKLLRA